MAELQMTTRFAVHTGKVDEFTHLAERCLALTRDRDSGTLQYDWFRSPAGDEFVLRERYRDSAAVLAHARNLGEVVPAMLAICTPAVEIYGAPSPELLQGLAALRPAVYSLFQSLDATR